MYECLEASFLHIARAHISKSRKCFNVKSSAHYLRMKTKILADFQICISVPLTEYNVRNIFLKNHAKNETRRLFPDLFLLFKKALHKIVTSILILIYFGEP